MTSVIKLIITTYGNFLGREREFSLGMELGMKIHTSGSDNWNGNSIMRIRKSFPQTSSLVYDELTYVLQLLRRYSTNSLLDRTTPTRRRYLYDRYQTSDCSRAQRQLSTSTFWTSLRTCSYHAKWRCRCYEPDAVSTEVPSVAECTVSAAYISVASTS